MKTKKIISSFEIFVLVTAVISFAYIIGEANIVSAQTDAVSSMGCCLQANDGSICQDVNTLDSGLCSTSSIPTSCDYVESCKTGCCYDAEEGNCLKNSPKGKCEADGGNWTDDRSCDSNSKCELGCCVIGNSAPITTSRECSKLSNQYGFTKKFEAIDENNGCVGYIGLADEGACVYDEGECSFTTKEQCQNKEDSEFYKDYLCTHPDLNTVCNATTAGEYRTACIEGKDEVYFVDNCGNRANIYDSSRAGDSEYWKTIISEGLCAAVGGSSSCGNCDYFDGSTCEEYGLGKDTKPDMGNSVCRNLNCDAYGKKHGESWCIGEYDSSLFGVAPVGSRNFKAICMDGEVTVEACADFNQEICLQQTSGSFSEAQCVTNDWRTCLSANQGDEETTYEDVKEECDKHPQCIMFKDIEGETDESENYVDWDMKGFPGFRTLDPEGNPIKNIEQASYNGVGEDYNKIIPHCVPKYTPGLQWWTDTNGTPASKTTGSSEASGTSSTANYGGGTAETTAICSLGNFVCIGGDKKTSLFGDFNEDKNIICIPGGSQADKTPVYLDTLNERCRMLGSCGAYVNIVGELGSNADDSVNRSIVKRVKIDAEGKSTVQKPSADDSYSDGYLESLKSKPGSYLALEEFEGTALGAEIPQADALKLKDIISQITGEAKYDPGMFRQFLPSAIGSLGGAISYFMVAGKSFTHFQIVPKSYGIDIAVAIIINIILNEWDPAGGGMSPGERQAAYSAFSSALAPVVTILILGGPAGLALIVAALVGVIISTIISVVTYADERKYYIFTYTCEPWAPPLDGQCSACNDNPIIPCSDYRCRSLGADCAYYNENGEPGVCAKLSDTTSATISPWQEAITAGYEYSDVQERQFTIDNVAAWTGIQFGVTTNKQAVCKIDTKRTDSFDEMAYDMLSNTGGQAYNHRVALSPFVAEASSSSSLSGTTESAAPKPAANKDVLTEIKNKTKINIPGVTGKAADDSSAETASDTSTAANTYTISETNSDSSLATLPIAEGENLYYIRCKNFAGQVNEAEFVVKVNVDEGPDLTAPAITRFTPESGGYVAYGQNSTSIMFYTQEPAECRYSQEYELAFEDMVGTTACVNIATLGEWPCYATLSNLNKPANTFYFICKDTAETSNVNEQSQEYTVNSCDKGLNITGESPNNEEIEIAEDSTSIDLSLATSGCIEEGKASCEFDLGIGPVAFFETESTIHSQPSLTFAAGNYNIPVKCTDTAGNTAEDTISFNITKITEYPIILLAYNDAGSLKIITDQESACKFETNSTPGCSFNYESEGNLMIGTELEHTTSIDAGGTYYVRCQNYFNITTPAENCFTVKSVEEI